MRIFFDSRIFPFEGNRSYTGKYFSEKTRISYIRVFVLSRHTIDEPMEGVGGTIKNQGSLDQI